MYVVEEEALTSNWRSKQKFCISPLPFSGYFATLELTLLVTLALTFLYVEREWPESFVLRAEAQPRLSPGNLLEMDSQAPGDLYAY